jgi:hypothetical protein
MTRTTLRSAATGRSIQTRGSNRQSRKPQFGTALRTGVGRLRRTPAQPVPATDAAPMWSLLLPPDRTHNHTEEAMPDPDAGPSHKLRARTLGGPS